MKIDPRVSSYMELLKNEPVRSATPLPGNNVSEAAHEAESVAVDFSASAVQLAEDEARRERLELIRQQLSEGSYNISGKDVANKILNILRG